MSSRRRRLNKRLQRGLDHVGRVFRAERFGQNVLHAGGFQHGAHGLAGDDAGAGRSRAQQNFRAAIVRKKSRAEWSRPSATRKPSGCGPVRRRGGWRPPLRRPCRGHADAALLVAHDDERAEIEAASALDDLGGAVDEDHLLGQLLAGLLVERRLGASDGRAGRGAAARPALIADCRGFGFSHDGLAAL